MDKGEGAYTGERKDKDGMKDKREHGAEHDRKGIQEQENDSKSEREPEQSWIIGDAFAEPWYLTKSSCGNLAIFLSDPALEGRIAPMPHPMDKYERTQTRANPWPAVEQAWQPNEGGNQERERERHHYKAIAHTQLIFTS
jgi:hypothetical protein